MEGRRSPSRLTRNALAARRLEWARGLAFVGFGFSFAVYGWTRYPGVDAPAWVSWGTSMTMGLSGLVGLLVFLLARESGAPVANACPFCSYDTARVVGGVCPECGGDLLADFRAKLDALVAAGERTREEAERVLQERYRMMSEEPPPHH